MHQSHQSQFLQDFNKKRNKGNHSLQRTRHQNSTNKILRKATAIVSSQFHSRENIFRLFSADCIPVEQYTITCKVHTAFFFEIPTVKEASLHFEDFLSLSH